MRARSLLLTLVAVASLGGLVPAEAALPPVEITMHNFRFCQKKTCEWTEQAYEADPRDGSPIGGQFNPAGKFPKVKPGQKVVFVYRDFGTPFACDNFKTAPANCEGHAPHVAKGKRIGFVPSRKGVQKLTWTVPANAKPGSRIPIYCDLQAHAAPIGMTGALDVVK